MPLYVPTEAPADRDGSWLHLLSVNISDANHDHERMLRYLERPQVDVLILLEVTETWATVVRRLEREYPYQLLNVVRRLEAEKTAPEVSSW